MFGKNQILKQQISDGSQLWVQAVFSTIQGEGPAAGRPAIFVRLAGCNLKCHFCVVGNTKVRMADRKDKNIKDIRLGEEVLSWDEATGTFVPKKVIKIFRTYPVDEVLRITTNLELLTFITRDHKILLESNEWRVAEEIKVGDRLKPYESHSTRYKVSERVVKEIKTINSETKDAWRVLTKGTTGKLEVWNLEVEGTNTYIVNGIVVHNCDTQFETSKWNPKLDELLNAVDCCSTGGSISMNSQGEVKLILNNSSPKKELVVITGGEPFRQNCIPLINALNQKGYRVQVETAGTLWLEDIDKHFPTGSDQNENTNMIVVSPKTSKINKQLIPYIHAYKYIIKAGEYSLEDGLPAASTQNKELAILDEKHIARPPTHFPKSKIYVQPCDEYSPKKNKQNLEAAAVICLKYGYRLSVQIHKLVNLE